MMLNNPWFTVVKHFAHGQGGPELQFEHPTLAGQQEGGWMTPAARRLPGAVLFPRGYWKTGSRRRRGSRRRGRSAETSMPALPRLATPTFRGDEHRRYGPRRR